MIRGGTLAQYRIQITRFRSPTNQFVRNGPLFHHAILHPYVGNTNLYRQLSEKTSTKTNTTTNSSENQTTTTGNNSTNSDVTTTTATQRNEILSTLKSGPVKVLSATKKAWVWIVEGAKHYWLGSRLLVKNIQISSRLLIKPLRGKYLTRREDRLLKQTLSDLVRLVPFAAFVVIPFLEFLLPVALKLFPGMLPSTFEDKLQKEEKAKVMLKIKLKMAETLQESVQDMAEEIKARNDPASATAAELERFMQKVREGKLLNTAYILRFSKQFKDEFTLESLSRPQLAAMCKYMGMNPFGTSLMLRVRLQRKFSEIRQDDKEILWEGVSSLSLEELQAACLERGIKPTARRPELEEQLEQWLELSKENVPASLRILSRSFTITSNEQEKPGESLATVMASLPEEMIEEIVMEKRITASDKSLSNEERLEFLLEQEEKVREEQEESEKKYPVVENVVDPNESSAQPKANELTIEKQIEAICHAILVLSSRSVFNLEKDDYEEIKLSTKDYFQESDNPEVNRSRYFVTKLMGNIENTIKKGNEKFGDKLHKIDADGDGVIERSEIEAAVKFLASHPNTNLVDTLLKKFDLDNDGKVKLSDVQVFLDRLEEGATASELLGEDYKNS